MEDYRFVKINEGHIAEILEIYNYYILNTTVTFHSTPMTEEEIKEAVFFTDPKYQTFVIMTEDDSICGYALLSQYKDREAYDGTAEITVYLKPDYTGQGIGSLAINYIEDVANQNDIHVLVATICGENKESINAFKRNGYSKCAHYRELGKKFGELLDVVAYQKIIGD